MTDALRRDLDREDVEQELAETRENLARLRADPPQALPFGHNSLNIQLWREHVARVEKSERRLAGLLAEVEGSDPDCARDVERTRDA